MDKLYLLEGDNEYLIEKELAKIIPKDTEVIEFDLEESSILDVIETLDTYDMFLKQKIVIAKNPNFYQNVDDNFPTNKYIKYLEHPSDNILIIITNKINNRLKLAKDTLKYFKKIEIKELNPITFIKENIKDYKMDNLTINYFINRVGNNYHEIYQELSKLKEYKLDDKIITKEDIDNITKKNFDDTIFDLIDAILKKDKVKVFDLYNYFISNGTEVFQILVLLSNQIRLIYNVKVLNRLSDFEIASILDVKEYPVKLARGKGLNYSKKELLSILYSLAIMDEDIKSGKQIPSISLLSYIMQM